MKTRPMNIVFLTLKKIQIIIAGVLFLVMHQGAAALDPSGTLQNFRMTTHDIGSGLPHNSIQCLLQDKNGYIWMGTPSGLARFDGVNTTIYNSQNTPALTSDNILSLCEDQNRVLWIGTDGGGLYSLDKEKWKVINESHGLSNNHLRAVTTDLQGHLWAGTDNGLNYITDEGIRVFTTEDGLYDNIITALQADSKGNLWVGTMRGGMARIFQNFVVRVYDFNDGLRSTFINSLFVDHSGILWIGTLNGLFYLPPEKELVSIVTETSFTTVMSIRDDAFNTLWIATMADGLKRLVKGASSSCNIDNGFPDNFIHTVLCDKQNTLWLGTDSHGLVQLKDSLIENITRKDGLPGNEINTVLKSRSGALWAGTRNKGLCKILPEKTIGIFNKETGLSENNISALYEDPLSGKLWIGTKNSGLNILDKNEKTEFLAVQDGLSSNGITAIYKDENNSIWVGTDNGLNNVENGKVIPFSNSDSFTGTQIRFILKDSPGKLNIGTNHGIFQKDGGSFRKVIPEKQNDKLDTLCSYKDQDGFLWIGTNGNGLLRHPSTAGKTCKIKNGLPDNYIFSITLDSQGYFWISSYKGVIRIQRRQLMDYFEDRIDDVKASLFDRTEGMAGSQCSRDGQPSFTESGSDRLIYPTNMGISIFDLNKITVPTNTSEAVIESYSINNTSVMNNFDDIMINKSDNISFSFTAFDYTSPEKITFRYKLEGKDHDWLYSYPGSKRIAAYKNIKPGIYKFIVQAAGNLTDWSNRSAGITFKVKKTFYQKTYFFLFLIFVMISITAGFFSLKRKNKTKEDTEKYKTSPVSEEKTEEIIIKLQHLMENEKLYLNPDLTLKDLSKKLRVHYNILSRVINEKFHLGYNDFINKYRIDEAKLKLSDPEQKNRTILEILYDCGFNSKSVFNTTFKKFTGKTPSAFRKLMK